MIQTHIGADTDKELCFILCSDDESVCPWSRNNLKIMHMRYNRTKFELKQSGFYQYLT